MSVEIDTDSGELRKTATLRRVGGSTVVTIPSEMCDALGLAPGDQVAFTLDALGADSMTLRPQKGEE